MKKKPKMLYFWIERSIINNYSQFLFVYNNFCNYNQMIGLKPDLHYRKKQSNLQKFLKQRPLKKTNYRPIEGDKYVYDQNQLIGDGYTSKVYKGYQANNYKKVYAVKIIDLRRISEDHLKLIENQIQIHPTLQHKNVVKCYDVIKTQRWIYLVLEYCPDGDLANFIHEKGCVAESLALDIIEQILQGYRYLIKESILHRDIKPANIFRKGKTWKISDFGFSVKGKRSMIDHINVGTPLYMPPESLQDCFYSHKSDIFAIGCILYQLISGRTPWYSKNQKLLSTIMLKAQINLSYFTNPSILNFVIKSCEVKQGKRITIDQFNEYVFSKSQINDGLQIKIAEVEQQKSQVCRKITKVPLSLRSTNWQQQDKTSRTMKSMKSQTTLQSSFYFKNSSEEIRENTKNLQNQFQFCHLLKYLACNSQKSILLAQNQKKSLIVLLCKHCIHLLKKIVIASNRPVSVDLRQWQTYKKTQDYIDFKLQLKEFQESLQKWFNNYLKSVSLKVVSEVNKKFPELNCHSQLSKKFAQNLRQYLRVILKDFSLQIQTVIKNQNTLTSPFKNSHYFYAFKSLYKYYTSNEQKIIKHAELTRNLLNQSKVSNSKQINLFQNKAQIYSTLNKHEIHSMIGFNKYNVTPSVPDMSLQGNFGCKKMTFPAYEKANTNYKNPLMFKTTKQWQKKQKPFDLLQCFSQCKMTKQSYNEVKKQIKWLI